MHIVLQQFYYEALSEKLGNVINKSTSSKQKPKDI